MTERPTGYQPMLVDLQPGGMSEVGFLDRGQTLEQVINRDRQALDMLDYTQQEAADFLVPPFANRTASGRSFEYIAPNGIQYVVKVERYRGMQECPWEPAVDFHPNSPPDTDLNFTEKGKGGESVRIAGLIIHLIESHGFFEGGSYRVAPEKIVEMFGTERIPGSFEKVRKLKF